MVAGQASRGGQQGAAEGGVGVSGRASERVSGRVREGSDGRSGFTGGSTVLLMGRTWKFRESNIRAALGMVPARNQHVWGLGSAERERDRQTDRLRVGGRETLIRAALVTARHRPDLTSARTTNDRTCVMPHRHTPRICAHHQRPHRGAAHKGGPTTAREGGPTTGGSNHLTSLTHHQRLHRSAARTHTQTLQT